MDRPHSCCIFAPMAIGKARLENGGNMARAPNYNHERKERDRLKAAKKAEKQAAKTAAKERAKPASTTEAETETETETVK
jgi:hypothetical protein